MSAPARGTAWLRQLSLRTRITMVTAAVVAVTLVVGGLLIVAALRKELVNTADDAGTVRARAVADLAATSELTNPLPVDDPETFVEVVQDGRIVAATEGIPPQNVFDLPAQEPRSATTYELQELPVDEPGPYRVAARGVQTPDGPMTVYVAVSIEDAVDMLSAATEIGAIGVVGLVTVLAIVSWFAIGRTLAPVDAIRARADSISGESLSSRVPEPVQDDEIGRLARTVNRMLSRLEDSSERQRRFVADAAHELRTPVASLRAQLETATTRPGGSADEGELLKDTMRMQAIVDQLLLLARADSGRPWIRAAKVDLDDVIDTAVTSVGRRDGVRVDAASVRPVQVVGDPDLLEQVFSNLLQNALRYADTTVRVSGGREDGVAVMVVEDDGRGVPSDRRAEIFERFFRLDESRDRDDGGLGLGLAIVAEIVGAHHGIVRVGDSDLGGARFDVELPVENDA
ncbi:MAG TPA: ATP-binding protein [Nocardioidaceae bacterium]|nr:ATP-binding protein [Nocardioidaceae bacterium]